MRFFIIGEGSSDLCDRKSGEPGFLANALVQLARLDGEENVELEGVPYVRLVAFSGRSQRAPRAMLMRGNKRMSGKLADVERRAEALGRYARQHGEGDGAVMFADCDFTHSEVNAPDRYHLQMIASIENGFSAAESFRNGVAMVPKMRSECWLLCKYQRNPYASGAQFEKLPANDKARNDAKKVLSAFLRIPVDKMYSQHIYADTIEWNRVDCPSFNFFKRRFRYVHCRMLHISTGCAESETLVTCGARL